MRRSSVVGVILVPLIALSLNSGVSGVTSPGFSAGVSSQLRDSPIQHVVIIYQENHSFDNVLGAVCQTRRTPCDGYTGRVTFDDGVTAQNVVMPDVVPDIRHDPHAQALAIANMWDQIHNCEEPPYVCVSHFRRVDIPNLARLADTFAVSDATFASGGTESFGAHITLAAGTLDGFTGYNPRTPPGHKPRVGWGCPSHKVVRWNIRAPQWVPSCVPDQAGNGPFRKSPVPYKPTVMQRIEASALSWHIYQGSSKEGPNGNLWSICTYFFWCYHNRFNLDHDSATSTFYQDAASGELPNLSFVLPIWGTSQHNETSMVRGDNYIGNLVSAVERSPAYASTAIFITYDDCGCFYDHVTPPAGLGLRDPMVIISPWVKSGYTDSTVAVQPYSMLAFVQHTFGLKPLTMKVNRAYDYAHAFDFQQHPIAPVSMGHTTIPARERARLARLAEEDADDDLT